MKLKTKRGVTMKKEITQLKKEFNHKILKLIVYTLLIMGVILILLIGSHNYYKDLVIKSQQENILNIVTTVSDQLEEYFKVKDISLKEVIKQPQLQEDFVALLQGRRDTVPLIDLLYNMGKEEYIALELIDREGQLIKAYTDQRAYQFRGGEDIQEAVDTQRDVYFIETLGDRSINILQPIIIEGKTYGFVRMKINTNYIYRVYLADYQLNQKGYISLKDKEGRLFLHPSEESIGEDVIAVRKRQYPDYDWSELEENVKKQMNRETGVGMYHSIWPGDGTRVKKLNGYTPCNIGDTFIILNFSVDYIETMTSFAGITNATILISILLIFTSLLIIFYIYKVEIKRNELQLEAMYFDELKEKNALLMHQSKFAAMGEMLATIAHQLKQPLNALKISLYNIEDYYTLRENDKSYLENLLKSNHRFVDKIAKTIDDFKYFFKPQNSDEAFNIYEAIEFSIELNMKRVNDLEINVSVKGDKELQIKGESNIFSQVILNLLNNSIDALTEISGTRRIEIEYYERDGSIVVELQDNGGGIKEEILERLFLPYVTTKGDYGTGLGLYISKYILKEKFQGELYIENTELGVKERIILPRLGTQSQEEA